MNEVSIPLPGNRHFYVITGVLVFIEEGGVSIPLPGNRHFYLVVTVLSSFAPSCQSPYRGTGISTNLDALKSGEYWCVNPLTGEPAFLLPDCLSL